jgi:hypothetical protein
MELELKKQIINLTNDDIHILFVVNEAGLRMENEIHSNLLMNPDLGN